jgi:hypothetical protein
MAEKPTLASLETRIRILERHVETLEQAAKVTRRKQRGWDAEKCDNRTDRAAKRSDAAREQIPASSGDRMLDVVGGQNSGWLRRILARWIAA